MGTWATLCGFTLAGYTVYSWYRFQLNRAKLRHIPTVGGDGFLTSYISAWKNVFSLQESVREGYHKYPNAVFKIPTLFSLTGWWVLMSGGKLTEDIRRAGPEHISFPQFVRELVQGDLLLHIDVFSEPYHVDVVRVALTRGYGACLPAISDEIECTLQELIPPTSDWTSYPLYDTMVRSVCRAVNRMFVGLPLCRNQEFLALNEKMAVHTLATATLLQILPVPMRGIAAKLFALGPRTHRSLFRFVGPIIEERLARFNAQGPEWEESKPNDLITWIIEAAPDHCRNVTDIVERMIFLNFVSVHTTSMTTTNALFDLAARQEYIKAFRDEAEQAISAFGWTKEAMARMVKIDAFLKESSRLRGVGAVSLTRKVINDLPLSNGVVVPAGSTVGVASYPIHRNPDVYDQPESFDGTRFLAPQPEREAETGLERHKNQLTSLDFNYLVFGHGRHACPGRFFAVAEMKAMMAYVLLNYDIKLDGGATEAPPGKWFAGQYIPDDKARLLFRARSKC